MPIYEYRCMECGEAFDKILRFSEYKTPQPCPNCKSGDTEKLISACAFILKGDDWPSKNMKIKRQKTERNARLRKKEEDFKQDGGVPSLAPNVEGEETTTWVEAKKLAASKGKNTSTYDRYVKKEVAK